MLAKNDNDNAARTASPRCLYVLREQARSYKVFYGLTSIECASTLVGLHVLTQQLINTCLISGALTFEPLQNILIYTKRNCRFRRLQLQAATDDATDDVTYLCLRMVKGGCALAGMEASEVSLGLG